jgi:proteasome accessory factor B
MLRLHEAIQAGGYPNCFSLGQELEVSPKTIQRDVDFMRDRMRLPLEYSALHRGFHYTREVKSFPSLAMSEGEMVALLVARKALEQYRGTPFQRQLEASFDKLTGGLKDRISFSPADELQSVSFRNTGLGRADLAVFNALSTAVLRQQAVEFEYRKSGESRAARRRVEPYHLAHRENLWYLVAHDPERGALRTFALPRIGHVKVLNARFTRPADFSPERFFASALGVLGGAGNFRVVVRFSASVADRVREREWHESQELSPLPEGGVELTLRLGALAEVAGWILSWGADAEVLRPPELRRRLAATAAALAERYSADSA